MVQLAAISGSRHARGNRCKKPGKKPGKNRRKNAGRLDPPIVSCKAQVSVAWIVRGRKSRALLAYSPRCRNVKNSKTAVASVVCLASVGVSST